MKTTPVDPPETSPGGPASQEATLGPDGANEHNRRAVGSIIGDDYRIEGELGAGAMGVVYRARHIQLDRPVAIKMWAGVGSGGVERMLREAMAMARLDHPNVVRVFDARHEVGGLLIAMEYVAGGTLRAWCRARRRSCREIVEVFIGAAHGLAAAHAVGVVHRDFKPDNVLIAEDGTPKVADFGIARRVQPDPSAPTLDLPDPGLGSDLTQTGLLMGTPAYMAPEQYEGRADARSDQFALCVALYEALYGERPFAGMTLGELLVSVSDGRFKPTPVDSDVPAALHQVVMKGLAAEPSARHRDLNALVRALRRAIKPRGPLALAIAGAALLMVLVGGAVTWLVTQRTVQSPKAAGPALVGVVAAVRMPEPVAPPPKPEPEERREPTAEPRPDEPVPSGGPKYRKWDTSKPFVCDSTAQWFREMDAHREEGPVIIALSGCYFRCHGCNLSGETIVEASGDAVVELRGPGTYEATGSIIKVQGEARVSVSRPLTIIAKGPGPAFKATGKGYLSLSGLTVEAERPLVGTGQATVTLEEMVLRGTKSAIEMSRETTLRLFGAQFDGPTRISGKVEGSSVTE